MTSSDMLFFIGAVSVITYVSGHIALTFPPARKYAFDFMDNIRTLPPCGVPKGLGPITDLTVGTPVLVQWHTAYPHSGGYRLALLDQNEREIYVFTQSNNGGRYFGAKDPTTLQHNITLPSQECRNCSIQLIRQAGEWYSSCGDYLFHSCADVNILPNNAPSKKCVHGSIDSNGKCVCDLTYVGDQCTFKEDCMSHGDCNNHGTCFKVSTTYYPSNQCYCDPGWFGRNCQLESPIKEKITDFSSYKMTTLSPDYKLYHKILQASNEIEVVMMVRSLTWVGLGWRPASFLSGCQYFPSLPGIVPGSGPTSAPGATSEPVNTPEPEATSEPVNTPEPEATSEPVNTPAPTSPPPCGDRWTYVIGGITYHEVQWTYNAVTDEITFNVSARTDSTTWAAIGFSNGSIGNFMPGSDVVMGFYNEVNNTFRLTDRQVPSYYARPAKDAVSNVMLISGGYSNGMLKFSFKRKRNTMDPTDFVFSDTSCPYLLIAYGGDYDSIMDEPQKHTLRFYKDNRICIKPCAPAATSKPITSPAPTSPPPCGDRWSNVTGGITYHEVQWIYNAVTDEITFNVSARTNSTKWAAIGFSNGSIGNFMPNSDVVMGFYNEVNNTFRLTDRQVPSSRTRPLKDTISNVMLLSGSYSNGMLTFSFKRNRNTTDPTDFVFSDTNCPYLLIAYGGDYNSTADEPLKHTSRFYTDNRICIKPCAPAATSKPITSPAPTSPPPCGDRWSNITGGITYHEVQWTYNAVTDEITFNVSARTNSTKWAAIGFSNGSIGNFMPNSDVVMGFYNEVNNTFRLTDRQVPSSRTRPLKDTISNVMLLSSSYSNGMLTFSFKRNRNTTDPTDFVFSDTNCPYLLIAYGGDYNSTADEPLKHTSRFNTDNRICIKPCAPLPTPEATAEPEGTPEGATSEPEGTPEGATSEPGSNSCARLPPGNSDTTGVNPHPMDCVDMVIGTTRGQMSRIGDYYSRDRSTPQFDSFYGGTESLTAALGYEENGYTTIIFRKKMTASERSDLPILNEYMQVIWARGQDFKNYSHSPPTGIDRVPLSDQSNPEYYKEDELKYHGHIGHRGVARINFLEGMVSPTSSCSWGSCTTSNCHMVSWSLDTLTGLINFTITADLEANQWIGLGFNDKQQMANADSIIGWVTTDGQVFLQDMKNPPSYGVPIRDATQNVQDVRGSIINGRTTISFRRPLVTNDANDFQFSTSNCAYFLFPKGGDFDNAAKSFTKHDSTPIISPQKICFPCSNNATTHMYVVEVRLIGIVWNRYYTDTKTDEYQTLKKDIEEGLMAQFKDSPGYQSVWVRRFKSGSVIAEVGIEMTGIETQTKAEVNKVMTDIVTNQKLLSGYSLDNVYPLSLGNALPVDKDQTEPKPAGGQAEEKETHIAVWFIVGIAAGALVLIVIMGLCTCCKNRRPKNPSQKYKHVQEDSIGPKYNDVQYGQQKKVVMNRNGQQKVVKPQPYEKWLEGNKSATNQYENPAYVGEEYKIETSFL